MLSCCRAGTPRCLAFGRAGILPFIQKCGPNCLMCFFLSHAIGSLCSPIKILFAKVISFLTIKRSNLYRQAFPLFCTITAPAERNKRRSDTTQNPTDLLRIEANSGAVSLRGPKAEAISSTQNLKLNTKNFFAPFLPLSFSLAASATFSAVYVLA